MRQLKAIVRFLAEQFRDRPAHGAKTRKSNFQFVVRGLIFAAGRQFIFRLRFHTLHFCRQIITSFGIGLVRSSLKTARIIRYFGIESRESDGLVRDATSHVRAESKAYGPDRSTLAGKCARRVLRGLHMY